MNNTTLLRALGVLAVTTIAVSGLSACTATETKGDTSASQKEKSASDTKTSTNQKPKAKPKPDNSSKGRGPLTWGNWQVVGKLQVKDDGLHSYGVVTRVKNTSDSPDEGIFTVTILKGTKILGTADCTTSTVSPGGVGLANCFSTDSFVPGWTEVTIENAF